MYTKEEIAELRSLMDTWFDLHADYTEQIEILLEETQHDYSVAIAQIRAVKNRVLAELDVKIETHPYHVYVMYAPSL